MQLSLRISKLSSTAYQILFIPYLLFSLYSFSYFLIHVSYFLRILFLNFKTKYFSLCYSCKFSIFIIFFILLLCLYSFLIIILSRYIWWLVILLTYCDNYVIDFFIFLIITLKRCVCVLEDYYVFGCYDYYFGFFLLIFFYNFVIIVRMCKIICDDEKDLQ